MRSRLQALVVGNNDKQLADLMEVYGGVAGVLAQAMGCVRDSVAADAPDATLGFDLRCGGRAHRYTLVVRDGEAWVDAHSPYEAPVTLELTAQDFLRLLARELDWVESFAAGRVTHRGDLGYLARVQGLFGQASPVLT